MADRGVHPGLIQRHFERSDRGFTRRLVGKMGGAIGGDEFERAKRAKLAEWRRDETSQVAALDELQRKRPLKPPGRK